jgi:hypothetical protein
MEISTKITKNQKDNLEHSFPKIIQKHAIIEGEVILTWLNENSTRFIGNFQAVERRFQHILFLNLNPSSQTNFVILALWTSRD